MERPDTARSVATPRDVMFWNDTSSSSVAPHATQLPYINPSMSAGKFANTNFPNLN